MAVEEVMVEAGSLEKEEGVGRNKGIKEEREQGRGEENEWEGVVLVPVEVEVEEVGEMEEGVTVRRAVTAV